ncbi:hypothetical protein V6N11_015028 [Hibiscus sabdariffa]|uniref:FAD linked oxidase N-terminal domain-containing protein n=1 Tax=Hibiscus sabdariffa TaxID=183260 RepID=A0ABR2TR51_9ROSI
MGKFAFLHCLSLRSNDSSSFSKLIFTPANSSYESVLESTIRNLRKHGLQTRTRSGGHDYEGLSFVVIDLVNFRSVDVDVENRVAWVQTGAILGELYYRIAEKSKTLAFAGGVFHTIGVGDHISGGGFGLLFRKYGTAGDNSSPPAGHSNKTRPNSFIAHDFPDEMTIRTPLSTPYYKVKSDYVKEPISKAGLNGLFSRLTDEAAASTTIVCFAYGGIMDRIPDPFPHRAGNLYKIFYNTGWLEENKVNSETHLDWARGTYNYMAPFVSKSPR